MSNLFRNMAARGGLSFAHLGRSQARASDNDDLPADDDSGKGKKGKRADDDGKDPDEQNREDGDSKKGKRADNDSSDDDDEDDDGEIDDDGKGSGKKGKRADHDDGGEDPEAEDDDDDEEEMRGKSAVAKARRRERARCAAIFACKAAGRNTELAAALAFESTMTRQEAIAVLNKSKAPAGSTPQRRNPSLGGGGEQSMRTSDAVAASWDVAFQKARGRK